MNIYDISKKSGVSIATVSRVLNNSDRVSEKTRKKVMDVIDSTGYTPNAFARGLGLNTMSTIGLMCSNSSDNYIASAVYNLEQGFRKHGYDCLLCCSGYLLEDKKKYLDLLMSKRVDAIVLIGSDYMDSSDDDYILSAAKKLPVILLNGYLEGDNVYSVLCDDKEITYKVTTDLLSQGARDLLFLARRMSFGTKQKLAGFEKAHKELNIPIADWQIATTTEDMPQVVNLLKDMDHHNIGGVIATEDQLAISALKFAKALGKSVPDDLAVIGYNNSDLSYCCEPELSSIDNKLQDCCSYTVELISSILKGETPEKTWVIKGDLIKRQTHR